MKAWIFSDLHLEFDQSPLVLPIPEADVCICAGDILDRGVASSIRWLGQNIAPSMPVLFVPGNHEYYRSSIIEGFEAGIQEATAHPNVFLLDGNSVSLGGFRFVGATLWTDFAIFADVGMALMAAKERLNDYRLIKKSKKPFRRFGPRDAMTLHYTSRRLIEEALWPPSPEPTVVISHHAPSLLSVPQPSHRQFCAALKRVNVHPTAADLEMLQSESWDRVSFAFPPGRSATQGLRRLRQVRPVPAKAAASLSAHGPTLADLHGYGPAAEWGFELARDLTDFREGRIDWSDVDAGVLISGPPGTGKTLFAEALARTCQVPIVHGTAAQWQATGYLNDFLKAMNADFDAAISRSPSILFIDEIDAFGDRAGRDGSNADYRRQAINGLLERLDGFNRRTGVVVVGACNHPEHLDAAIRRAGRLDRHFTIDPPDAAARLRILEYYTQLGLTGVEAQRFVGTTNGMTGADIRQLVRDAKRSARRRSEALRSGDILAHLPPTCTIPADLLRTTAIHEAGHVIVGMELGCGTLKSVQIRGEIVPGSVSAVGGALFETPPFRWRARQFYLDRIALALGGIAAETIVLGSFSDGATGGDASDLATATRIATHVEACFGMGDTLLVEAADEATLARLRVINPELRRSIRRLLDQEFERAKAIVDRHRVALEELVSNLLETRNLAGEAAAAILAKHRGYRTHVSLRKVP